MKIILCSGNMGKVAELALLLPGHLNLIGLKDTGLPMELPETGDSLEENAMEKARYVFDRTGLPCIADDSGLEIDALVGRPGVYSARYAGPHKNAMDNNEKVLREMANMRDRKARMRTIIAYKDRNVEWMFEGVLNGTITSAGIGSNGFGYDTIFRPIGHTITLAEMTMEQKNALSHRSKAVSKLLKALGDHIHDPQ